MDYFLNIFFGTFVLEDVALAASVVWVSKQKISFFAAYMACFLGISIGDLGLYFIGYLVTKINFESRIGKYLSFFKKLVSYKPDRKAEKLLTYSIFVSRFIPGTRIPTYLGAGLLGYSFVKFFVITVVSVGAWVLFVLMGGASFYNIFKGNLILALTALFILLIFIKATIPNLATYWSRRAWIHSWRKWTRFEFWPAVVFYIPIVPIYIFRSLKGHSFVLPFYANPQILNSGLIGESKWDFLKHLNPKDSTTLKSLIFKAPKDSEFCSLNEKEKSCREVKDIIASNGFSYPFILKPDVGQRGYGVRIIKSEADLEEYLKLARGMTLVLQTFSKFPKEAGIFYFRKPSQTKGVIFSITDKKFPFVIGDGISRLGDLILKDKRARIIASTYFDRLKHRNLNEKSSDENFGLNEVIKNGEVVYLSECGNHCQGAIFENGEHLKTEALLNRIDLIAKSIPDFYFGRFDIRYLSAESLKEGKDFEIVEVNGAGAEATHIWDEKTSLLESYKVLFRQWTILFEIGFEIKQELKLKKRSICNVHVFKFLKEATRVFFRKDQISVSS